MFFRILKKHDIYSNMLLSLEDYTKYDFSKLAKSVEETGMNLSISCKAVFRIRKSGEPEYLARKLKYDNILQNIIIPNTGLSLAKQSFTYRAAQQWNLLPKGTRNILKIGKFKKELRKWTMMNIPRFND